MRSDCDPRDAGGIRHVNEDTLGMEDFKSCTGGIIELRESVFVTDEQRGRVDPLFQFSLDSSETLDGDVLLADCKTHVLRNSLSTMRSLHHRTTYDNCVYRRSTM